MISISKSSSTKKVLSVFGLVCINLIAVDSLRSFAISAEFGFTLIFYYLCGALFFMIPVALCSAEMASTWPEEGGIYAWTKHAFGIKTATLAAWLQWIYNIVWYPTILSFLASTLFYLISPALSNDKHLIIGSIFILFWMATAINFFGMKASSRFSNVGAIIGTLFPIAIIIGLTITWVMLKKPLAMHWHSAQFFPDLSHLKQLAVLSGMLFGLVGIEMSAIHAKDAKDPQRTYPKAIFISVCVILFTAIFSSLAIALVVPPHDLILSSALIKTFSIYCDGLHMSWLLPIMVACIIIGGLASISAWIIGPSRCMFCACEDGAFPKMFAKTNRFDVPYRMMLLQGAIFTVLCAVFWWFPGFNDAYWLLSNLTAQVSVIFYALLLIVLIRLRIKFPSKHRPFKIPGRLGVAVLVAGVGIVTCLFVFVFGLLPPEQIALLSVSGYETVLISGIVIICLIPIMIAKFTQRKRIL
jgi:amino acid transporter